MITSTAAAASVRSSFTAIDTNDFDAALAALTEDVIFRFGSGETTRVFRFCDALIADYRVYIDIAHVFAAV